MHGLGGVGDRPTCGAAASDVRVGGDRAPALARALARGALRLLAGYGLASAVVLALWVAVGGPGGVRALAPLLAVPADPWLVVPGAVGGDPVPFGWVLAGAALPLAAVTAPSRVLRALAALAWGGVALVCVACRHVSV